MITQTKGKIFITEERGLAEQDWFKTYNTFSNGEYYNKHKMPFGALYVLNENILAAERSISFTVEKNSAIIILPTVGDIEYSNSNGESCIIQVGQAQQVITAGTLFTITNPYKTEAVSFIQLWISLPAINNPATMLCAFDIDAKNNSMVNLFEKDDEDYSLPAPYNIAIGRFGNLEETIYTASSPNNGLFVFVIEGAFDAQHRLLHSGDGLALWDVDAIQLEALSNDAVVLLAEVALG